MATLLSAGCLLSMSANAQATPLFTITGQLLDRNGAPLHLTGKDSAIMSDGANFSVRVQPDGSFVLPNNPAGSARISFDSYQTSGLAEAALPRIRFTTNDFPLTGDMQLNFALPSSVVTTHVLDPDRAPVKGVFADVRPNASTYAPIQLAPGISAIPTAVYGPAFWDTSSSAYTDVTGTARARIYPSASVWERVYPGQNTSQPDPPRLTQVAGIDGRNDVTVDATYDIPAAGQAYVTDTYLTEGNSGLTQSFFYAELWHPTTQPVTLSYATRDLVAVAGVDYVATSGTVTIPAGSTYAPIPVSVYGDTTPERRKSFALDLTQVSGPAIYSPTAIGVVDDDDNSRLPEATAEINPDDPFTPPQIAPFRVPALYSFAINCTQPGAHLGWQTVDGSAHAGVDYVAASGVYTCPSDVYGAGILGGLAVTLLPVAYDPTTAVRSFQIRLTSADSGVRIVRSMSTVYIQNSASVTYPVAYADDVSVEAGQSSVQVPIHLSQPVPGQDVTVQYATDDLSAVRGIDYTPTTGSINFAPGETDKTVTVPLTTTSHPTSPIRFSLGISTLSPFVSVDRGAIVTMTQPVALTSISPSALAGGRHRTFTLTGIGLQPGALVTVSGSRVVATPVRVSGAALVTTLTARANASAGTRDVTVLNSDGTSGVCRGCLTINPAPTLASLAPSVIAQGASLTAALTGEHLQAGARVRVVGSNGAVKSTVAAVTSTSIDLVLQALKLTPLQRYDVAVTNPDGGIATCFACLEVISPPTITSVSPTQFARGSTDAVTISGTGFAPGLAITVPRGVMVSDVSVESDSAVTATFAIVASANPRTDLALRVQNVTTAGSGRATYVGLTIS